MALQYASLTIPPARAVNAAAAGAAARQLPAAADRACVPLVYGEDRLGGLVLNVLPTTSGGTTVLVQLLWCHACDSVNDFRWNDQALPGGAAATHYTGSQTTPDAAVVAAFAAQGITYAETLNGFAYSVVTFPASLFDGSLAFSSRIRGRRLYDPRLDSTAGGSGSQRLNNPATWTWSANPVLALADFVVNTVYGASEPVDWTTIAAAANHADANVGSPAEPRRRVGVSFTEPVSIDDLAEALRAYAGCWIFPGASGVRVLADQDVADSATYTHAAGQIAAIDPLALRDLGNSPTVVEVLYTDTSRVPYRQGSAVAQLAGAGTTLPWRVSQVNLPGVQRYSQAYREAVERLNKLTLQDVSTTVELFDDGIRHDVGDVIRITHPIGLTLRRMRITDVLMTSLGRWRLPLVEHDPAVYSTAVATLTLPPDTPRVIGAETAVPWGSLMGRPANLSALVGDEAILLNQNNIIRSPEGGVLVSTSSLVTGAIRIRLPQGFTDTMMKFFLDVYEYGQGLSCTLEIAGYTNSAASSWLNTTARVVGSSNVEYPVRFGHDGVRVCIWIGNQSEQWSYPQIRVRDWFGGFANFAAAQWATGWAIAFDASAPTGVTSTIIDTLPGADWGKVSGAGRPANNATVGAPTGTNVGNTLAQIVESNAATALTTANTASTNASNALSTLQNMRSNGFLDAAEKPALIREWNAIYGEVNGIYAEGTAYGLTALRDAYNTAFAGLASYLDSLSPSWSNTTVDTPITPATDQAAWLAYYNARQALLNAIASEAGKRAVWATVIGPGRPSDNATRDVTLVSSGSIFIAGNSIEKTASPGSWDAAAYSRESYSGGAFVSFSPAAANLRFMLGLNTDPTFSDSWQTLDYAIYVELGALFVAESGALVGSLTTYAAGDSLAVTYDGATVRYLKNGVAFRSVSAVVTQPLYLDSSFLDVGARADRVVFGPMSAVRDIATQQLAPGSVTDSYFSTPADGSVSSTTVGAGRHTVATTSWTNTTTGPVVVEITLAFAHRRVQVYLGGTSGVKSFFGLQLTGSDTLDYKKVSPNATDLMPSTIVANSTVPAGQTLTMTVFAEPTQQSGWVMSVFWSEVQFRWAAIKR
jgi:hypothetical protein